MFSQLVPSRLIFRIRTYRKCTLLLCLLVCIITISSIQRTFYTNPTVNLFHQPFERLSPFSAVLKIFHTMNLNLVLLDSKILKYSGILKGSQIKNTDRAHGDYNIVSFGIFENESRKVQDYHEWRQLRPTWWLTEAVGTDYRRLHIKEEFAVYTSLVTHYFFISPTFIVHLAIIFERNNFFWIAGLNNSLLPSRYQFLTNLTYGIPLPMAVDAFNCSHVPFLTYPNYNICIPANVEYYLWQVPYAHFYECHYEDVVYPFKRQYRMSEADTDAQREALNEVVGISKALRIPTMLIFGTLLGWYRQCDYIVESLDMDVAMLEDEWKQEMFDRVFNSKILTMYRRLGTLDLGLEFRTHTDRWVWLDIFLMYPRTANNSFTYMLNQKYWMKSTYPLRKGICSAELLGVLVFIPCNYKEYIWYEYGDDGWFAPVGGHPHRNMQLESYFEDKEIVYLEHIYSNFSCPKPSVMWGCDPVPPELENSTLYQQAVQKETG